MDWVRDARCKDCEAHAAVLGTVGEPSRRAVAAAASTCYCCPVFDECFVFAAEQGVSAGVWAGQLRRFRR